MSGRGEISLHCGIVILAAGASRRLGKPKQLLPYKGRSLLWHASNTALATGLRPVVVVIGQGQEKIAKELEGMDLQMAENSDWEEGMASSLRCGLEQALKTAPDMDAVIFMVCDQPFVSAGLLAELALVQGRTVKPIVASAYNEQLGTPALFTRRVFPALLELKGDAGARKLIKAFEGEVAVVPFPEGGIDIDTQTDYEQLMEKE